MKLKGTKPPTESQSSKAFNKLSTAGLSKTFGWGEDVVENEVDVGVVVDIIVIGIVDVVAVVVVVVAVVVVVETVGATMHWRFTRTNGGSHTGSGSKIMKGSIFLMTFTFRIISYVFNFDDFYLRYLCFLYFNWKYFLLYIIFLRLFSLVSQWI